MSSPHEQHGAVAPADVGALTGDVALTAVESEEEATREFGQLGDGTQGLVEFLSELLGGITERRSEDVADPFVRRRRQEPGHGEPARETRPGDAAQLDVAAGGQVEGAVPEVVGGVGERPEPGRRDGTAGQPDPGERTVGGVVRGENSRARICSDTGARGHAPTVDGPLGREYVSDHM